MENIQTPIEQVRPGMTVLVDGQPELVYHGMNIKSRVLNTNKGQRYMTSVVEVVPESDMLAKVRQEDPEKLYQHIEVSIGQNLGADPEVFMVDAHGEVLPAFVYLPAKPTVGDKNQTQSFYDGFQAEFTVPACSCLGYLTDYVRVGLQQVRAAGRAIDPAARIVVDGVLPISYEMRRAVDPQHLVLGCAPSKNVYGEPPLALPSPEDLDVRFAGSHMHFGIQTFGAFGMTMEAVERAVRLLDAVVGVGLVSFGEGVQNKVRRQYYGKAGEYRYNEKMYKIEYRVPDVNLIAHPATFNLIWELARIVVKVGLSGMGFLWDASEEETVGIINEYDVAQARKVLARNENVLRAFLGKVGRAQESDWGNGPEWTEIGTRTIMHGIGTAVRDPKNIEDNWKLDWEVTPIPPSKNIESWWSESYSRKHANWPTGRIWSSAAKFIEKGELV